MRKITIFFILTLIITPLVGYAKSSVWVAEKDNQKILLAGSVHLIHPSQLPLPKEYLQAFNDSKRIVFEIDLAELNPIAIAKMTQQFKLQGITLDKTLKPDVWDKLKVVMQQHHIPMQMLAFDASFMSFTLPMIIWGQQGYQEGIDQIFYNKAKVENKEIVGLETFEQQLVALTSLKKIDPNLLIEKMLKDLNDPRFSLETIIKQVYAGDTRLALLSKDEAHPEMDVFNQYLLVDRNNAWISKIEQFAASNKPTLVVVGAMHLVGPDSVLKLLEADGYKISYYNQR